MEMSAKRTCLKALAGDCLGLILGFALCCTFLRDHASNAPEPLNRKSKVKQIGLRFRCGRNDLAMNFEKLAVLNKRVQGQPLDQLRR